MSQVCAFRSPFGGQKAQSRCFNSCQTATSRTPFGGPIGSAALEAAPCPSFLAQPETFQFRWRVLAGKTVGSPACGGGPPEERGKNPEVSFAAEVPDRRQCRQLQCVAQRLRSGCREGQDRAVHQRHLSVAHQNSSFQFLPR